MVYVDPYGLWGEGVYNYGRGLEGVLQIAGGFTEASLGAVFGAGTAGAGSLLGGAMVLHGMDHMCTGYHKVFNGEYKDTLTSQVLQSTGLSPTIANFTDNVASLGSSIYAASKLLSSTVSIGSNLPKMSGSIAKNEGLVYRGADGFDAGLHINCKLDQLRNMQLNAVKTRILPDGRIRYYAEQSLSKTPGPTSGACRVLEWNPQNGFVRTWHECYNRSGNVNRVHPKYINGEFFDLPHYPPTAKDLQR